MTLFPTAAVSLPIPLCKLNIAVNFTLQPLLSRNCIQNCVLTVQNNSRTKNGNLLYLILINHFTFGIVCFNHKYVFFYSFTDFFILELVVGAASS